MKSIQVTKRHYWKIATTLGAIACLISTGGITAASASTDDTISATLGNAEQIAASTPTPIDAKAPAIDREAFTVDVDGSDLSVALGASAGSTVTDSNQYATAQDDSLIYAVSIPKAGTTRFSAIINTPESKSPYWTFDEGTQLLLLDDGSVSLSDGEQFLGGIDAPWAIDADGQALPTRYEIAGTTLTQVVDTTNATFPVVADPTVNFYGPYIQVHLNRWESVTAVSGIAACAAVLSKTPVPWAKALSLACGGLAALGSGQLVAGKCFSIHYVVGLGGPQGTWWPWVRNC